MPGSHTSGAYPPLVSAEASGDEVFGHAEAEGFEQVVFGHDSATGLRAVVAVHSTVLGPAIGGTRFRPYEREAAAVTDVCRLARGMTFKHAVAGLDAGGGKAVILGEPATLRSDQLMRAYARVIDGLGGRYLTAEDVGTNQADMDLIGSVTPYVTGRSVSLGGSGDPSPATAWGVRCAFDAVAKRLWGAADLAGRHVVVSGVGKVGSALVDHLIDAGCRVTVADVAEAAVLAVRRRHPAVEVVDPADAHAVACDVFSPCAMGAVLSGATIAQLRCAAVCGSANNQLQTPADGARLADHGVLYAPDYVVNAGGVINIAEERRRSGATYDRDRAWAQVAEISTTLQRVLARADADGTTPAEAADRLVEERLAAANRVTAVRSVTT